MKSANERGTELIVYRYVSPAELRDLETRGALRCVESGFVGGKFFWRENHHAVQFGGLIDRYDRGGPGCVVWVEVPDELLV